MQRRVSSTPVASSSSRPRVTLPRHFNRRSVSVKAVASFQQRLAERFAGTPSAPVPASSAPPESGTDLGWKQDFNGTFVKGKLIGAGSFGQVHMAVHKSSGQEVAVKTLPKIRGKLTKEKTLEKICRETDMLERLQSCKGVVRLVDCFEDDTHVQLVTELCAGGDLQKYIEAYGPLEEKALALVTFEVLKIVKACHDLGILHGDVKPANFCLKEKARDPFVNRSTTYLKAIDFGCSQFLGLRRLSKRTGTPVFMSPEIFARDYAAKADIWSTGVMLYWLYCQRFPFFQNAEVVKAARLEEVADAVSNTEIKYDFGPWPNLSKEGVDFISSCLTRPEAQRMSLSEALQHPWLAMHLSQEDLTRVQSGGPPVTIPPAA